MVINLTPHPVHIYRPETPDGAPPAELQRHLLASLPPSGRTARLSTTELGPAGIVDIAGVPVGVAGVRFGELEGVPAQADGVVYVVPLVSALAARRGDFLVPHGQVRNADGTVVGCRLLGRLA